jgi:hypothetical protein
MITSIIFSKNRACQLDLLLRSMRQNLPNFRNIFVLYHATTPEFEQGYELIHQRFQEFDTLIHPQSNFQFDTMDFLYRSKEYVCFFVDDNIIYRPCDIDGEFIDTAFTMPNLTCFTLRLGKNTIVQDQYNNQPTVFPENLMLGNIDNEYVLLWNWQTIQCFGNFGYPFSVDGHIYKTEDILPLLNYEFDTPNAFEGRFDKNKFNTNLMCCFEQSVLVNNPINIVGSSNNNAGLYYGQTLEELNKKYLDNHQISLNSIMEENIVGCHQEMKIEFERMI